MLHNLVPWALFPFLLPLSSIFPPPFITPDVPHNELQSGMSIESTGTSSEDITVRTNINGSSTTMVIHSPYGVRSEVVSENGVTHATTTPLTEEDIKQMHEEEVNFQKHMDSIFQEQEKMFQEQEKIFDEMRSDF